MHQFVRPQSHTYYVKTTNDGSVNDIFTFESRNECSSAAVTIKFKTRFRKGDDVTSAVCGSGLPLDLDPDETQKLRVRIRVGTAAPFPGTGTLEMDLLNSDETGDTIRAKAKIVG